MVLRKFTWNHALFTVVQVMLILTSHFLAILNLIRTIQKANSDLHLKFLKFRGRIQMSYSRANTEIEYMEKELKLSRQKMRYQKVIEHKESLERIYRKLPLEFFSRDTRFLTKNSDIRKKITHYENEIKRLQDLNEEITELEQTLDLVRKKREKENVEIERLLKNQKKDDKTIKGLEKSIKEKTSMLGKKICI